MANVISAQSGLDGGDYERTDGTSPMTPKKYPELPLECLFPFEPSHGKGVARLARNVGISENVGISQNVGIFYRLV